MVFGPLRFKFQTDLKKRNKINELRFIFVFKLENKSDFFSFDVLATYFVRYFTAKRHALYVSIQAQKKLNAKPVGAHIIRPIA